jgi:uncharacterized protein (DUF4415 family)
MPLKVKERQPKKQICFELDQDKLALLKKKLAQKNHRMTDVLRAAIDAYLEAK